MASNYQPTIEEIKTQGGSVAAQDVNTQNAIGNTNFGNGLPNTTINSAALTPATPINLPNPTPSTDASGVLGRSQALSDQIKADVAAKQAEKDSSLSALNDITNQIAGVQTNFASSQGDKNTPGSPEWLKEQARLAANGLDVSQRAQLNEQAALNGQGLTDVQKSQSSREINRKYALEQGDLQLKYHLAQSDYTAAEDTLTRKFNLQLEPLKTKLDLQTKVYDQVKGDLSKSEDRQWTQLINQSNLDLQTTAQNKTDIKGIFAEAAKNGIVIPPDVGVKVSNATDANQAYQILQSNGISLQNPLDVQAKKAQLALTYANIAKTNTENAVLSIKDAQALGVPYGTTKGQAIALGKVPGVSTAASELKTNALSSAQSLLEKIKSGTGTSAIGGSRLFQLQNIPGTNAKDFQVQLDNLKSLLSLDNVKLLKGQGQVSDSERLLLERASGKLDPGQSEASFKSAVEDVVKALSGEQSGVVSEEQQLLNAGYTQEQVDQIKSAK